MKIDSAKINSGQSLVELLVAFGVFSFIVVSAVIAYTKFDRQNVELKKKLAIAAFEHNERQLIGNPEYFMETFGNNYNGTLLSCVQFEKNCPSILRREWEKLYSINDQTQVESPFQFSSGPTGTLIIKMSNGSRMILSRYQLALVKLKMRPVSCPRYRVVAGIDTFTGMARCAAPDRSLTFSGQSEFRSETND